MFCGRQLAKNNGLAVHQKSCKFNPNRISGQNHFTKAKETGVPYVMSSDTLEKFRISSTGRTHSKETIDKLSMSMKLAVANNPKSYRGNYNRGFVGEIICSNGFIVLGTWEQAFVEFCIINNIKIIQPDYSYNYEYEGTRSYFPDFFLPEHNSYVEVKGVRTERDVCKWESMINVHKKNLLIIDKRNINSIKDNSAPIETLMKIFIYTGATSGIRTHDGISSPDYESGVLGL